MTYNELWRQLTQVYDDYEAKAIARMVYEVRFGLMPSDLFIGKDTQLSTDDQKLLEEITQRLLTGEPVQYVLGEAEFGGRTFHVEPGVLIPRPETAELCRMVIEERDISQKGQSPLCEILDIGTGSGCIAITLALELPDAHVSAWDISDDALRIASANAKALGANVTFEHRDALDPSRFTLHSSLPLWDLIVSNPPYICNSEADGMARNVLDYEPHEALFGPVEDPALFYKRIGDYASIALKPGGRLYFELNPLTADEVSDYLKSLGFIDMEIRQDQFGKSRFLKATKI